MTSVQELQYICTWIRLDLGNDNCISSHFCFFFCLVLLGFFNEEDNNSLRAMYCIVFSQQWLMVSDLNILLFKLISMTIVQDDIQNIRLGQ